MKNSFLIFLMNQAISSKKKFTLQNVIFFIHFTATDSYCCRLGDLPSNVLPENAYFFGYTRLTIKARQHLITDKKGCVRPFFKVTIPRYYTQPLILQMIAHIGMCLILKQPNYHQPREYNILVTVNFINGQCHYVPTIYPTISSLLAYAETQ